MATNTEKPAISLGRLAFWACAIFFAINWSNISPLLYEGILPGPDDYLRYHQINELLAGQAWFDTSINRMIGSDIHWSRLTEIPIVLLTGLFGIFVEADMALRLAALVWPAMLFVVLLLVIARICDPIADRNSRLLILFFAGLNAFIAFEFTPGRLDHHNVQMILLLVAGAGLFASSGWSTALAVGLALSASVAIGLEMVYLYFPILAGLALAWVFGGREHATTLLKTGVVLVVSSMLLYVGTIPPALYLHPACDANSIVYLTALTGIGSGFALLGGVSLLVGEPLLTGRNRPARLLAGGAFAGALLLLLAFLFPHCLAGPLGGISEELNARWLSTISEAQGLFDNAQVEPHVWIVGFSYLCLMMFVCTFVAWKKGRDIPHLYTLAAVVWACALISIFQVRVLRTGILVATPFCVIFAGWAIAWLEDRLAWSRPVRALSQILVCVMLSSWFWTIAALSIVKEPPSSIEAHAAADATIRQSEENSVEKPNSAQACASETAMRLLATLPPSVVISDLNTAAPIIVHTHHTAISGNYHRNEKEILMTLDFMQGVPEEGLAIAGELDLDLVVTCMHEDELGQILPNSLAEAISKNKLPDWLEWISAPDDDLAILKVK